MSINLVNIDSRGYGKIYKAIMRNRELPLLAKTIYAYFCAYAGNGFKAFPKRDKIVRDLQINKDTYTKYLNCLVMDGYIAKERTNTGNIYTVMHTIPAYSKEQNTSSVGKDGGEPTDLLVFENVGARGFGTVPKLVMLDTRLSAQAKAIYAYFASFAGAGTTAFPRRSTVMRELMIKSTNTYYHHLNQLVEYGFLIVEQQKNGGRFSVCIYQLNDVVEPGLARPYSKQDDKGMTQEPSHRKNSTTSKDATKGETKVPKSEKVHPGGKLPGFSQTVSRKVISEKLRSEKTVAQKNGQPYINNSFTTNNYLITEQENNHQPHSRPMAGERPSVFSFDDVKQCINFDHLQAEVAGWGQLLKNTLGSLDTAEVELRYYQVMDDILMEIVTQLTECLNKATEPNSVIVVLQSEAFTVMFDDIMTRWDNICNVRAYIDASLKNLIEHLEYCLPKSGSICA